MKLEHDIDTVLGTRHRFGGKKRHGLKLKRARRDRVKVSEQGIGAASLAKAKNYVNNAISWSKELGGLTSVQTSIDMAISYLETARDAYKF